MKFVVGIGNFEQKYNETRHNIGFRALDEWIGRIETARKKKLKVSRKFQAQIFALDGVLLIKPQTYVNCTGDSVVALLREYGASPSDFLFVCDDVNLALGKLRLRGSGGAGGHHGLESVIAAFGSKDFSRLRIGVASEAMPKDDLTDYVLGKFDRRDKEILGEILGKAVSICEGWIEEGLKAALDRLSKLQSNQQGSE